MIHKTMRFWSLKTELTCELWNHHILNSIYVKQKYWNQLQLKTQLDDKPGLTLAKIPNPIHQDNFVFHGIFIHHKINQST